VVASDSVGPISRIRKVRHHGRQGVSRFLPVRTSGSAYPPNSCRSFSNELERLVTQDLYPDAVWL